LFSTLVEVPEPRHAIVNVVVIVAGSVIEGTWLWR